MKISSSALAALLFLGASVSSPAEPASVVTPNQGEKGKEAPTSAAANALTWDQEKVVVDAKLGQKVVRGTYRFTNTSKNPVTFVDLVPSCGCVSTQIDKLDYAPGESGELKVTLDLEATEEAKVQDRSIVVMTSDAPKIPTTLRFIVNVPVAVEASVESLSWKVGDKPETKDVLVSAGPGIEDLKLSLESQNSDFAVEIKPETEGRSYHVSITPTATKAPCFAQIRLNAQSSAFRRPIAEDIRVAVVDAK